MANMAGLWKMSGHQNMFPNVQWEADLLLNTGGTLTWTETKGANVGASRAGRWTLSGNAFYFQYQAPNVGMVTWDGTVDNIGRNMSGTYNAGANNAYGGIWSARKP
jgi:hypothetical protein